MNNQNFLNTLKQSFTKFLQTGSRSNEKLKILHGAIAEDLHNRLEGKFIVKSLGFEQGKEGKITGRYIDKNVDIAVYDQNGKSLAGIGVKFVMQNYSQNSNNYFENMLGETANIQSNCIPYFQIFIIPDKVPYYNKSGIIAGWEKFNLHHACKYMVLSKDDPNRFLHSPSKMLFYILHIKDESDSLFSPKTQSEYIAHYLSNNFEIASSNRLESNSFGDNLILNDYEKFIEKVKHHILSI